LRLLFAFLLSTKVIFQGYGTFDNVSDTVTYWAWSNFLSTISSPVSFL